MSLFSITSEMRFVDKCWHSSLQSPLGSFRMIMVLRELLILWQQHLVHAKDEWGRCPDKLHSLFDSDLPTFFFLTVFLVVQLLQLKNWQCPRTKVSLILPKPDSVLSRVTGMTVPYAPCVRRSYTEGPSPPTCQHHGLPSFQCSAATVHLKGRPSSSSCHWNELLDPPEVQLKINLCAELCNVDESKRYEIYDNMGFPDSSVGKESACNAGDPSSIPGLGRSAGEGIGYPLQYSWVPLVKNLPAIRMTWVWSLGWEDPLEKGKATHSSIVAWRMPWTVYPWGHKESDMTEWLSLSLHMIACINQSSVSLNASPPVSQACTTLWLT